MTRALGRVRRHRRIRQHVVGFPNRPRMCVFRSHKHTYVQLINDLDNTTLLGRSTKDARLRDKLPHGGNVSAALALGQLVAEEALKQGITQVVFDRGGYRYHGRVKALAEAAQQGGLRF